MDVILLERVEKLGQMGDVVAVKPGYARNFLLPRKKAMRATEENRSVFARQRAQLEAASLESRSDAENVGKKMDGLPLVLLRQAGETGHLYGSVNARDIAKAADDAGFTIERTQVNLQHPIKTLGMHNVFINLHPEVRITVKANVARSDEEAKIQAKTGKAVTSQDEEEKKKDQKKAEKDAAKAVADAEEAFDAQAEQVFENPDEAIEKHADEIHEVAENAAEDTVADEVIEEAKEDK